MTRFVTQDDSAATRRKGKTKEREPKQEPNLLFFSDYESGNLHKVKPLNDGIEYEISLRPDTLADQYRNWFYFSCFGCRPNQRVVFSVVNFSKQRSLYRDRMTPLVRSRSRPHLGWARLPPRNCFYYKSSRHGGQYLLSFVFTFDGDENEVYDFAYSFPYPYTKLQKYLDTLERTCCCSGGGNLDYRLERSLLCRTNQMRRVDMIEISGKEGLTPTSFLQNGKQRGGRRGSSGKENGNGAAYLHAHSPVRPVIAITGRVHPGETPASFVIQGFLDFVTSQQEEACYLRKAADIVVVPMLNPDGVFLGNYRTDATGVDLNRRWDAPSKEIEPSLYWTKELLKSINKEKGRKLDMFIDVHAHSTSKRSFMFCNPPKSMEISSMGSEEDLKEKERDWATMNRLRKVLIFLEFLDMYMLEFSMATCRWDIDSHKVGSARRALEKILPETLCYTFEASFFHDIGGFSHSESAFGQKQHKVSQEHAQSQAGKVNTEKGYIGMGEQLGRALSHYYKSLERF